VGTRIGVVARGAAAVRIVAVEQTVAVVVVAVSALFSGTDEGVEHLSVLARLDERVEQNERIVGSRIEPRVGRTGIRTEHSGHGQACARAAVAVLAIGARSGTIARDADAIDATCLGAR
jgi:hypothetical protein